MIKIALDAMGGDYAPEELIKGAILAVEEYKDVEVVLVGDEEKINSILKKSKNYPSFISIMHASEVIGMDESPVQAVKDKKGASINIALDLSRAKVVEAVVSAGNTGAFMTAALFKLGRVKGIERPAIATIFPNGYGQVILLDMGANVDNKPSHLKQFAEMGSLYAEHILHINNPRVGLLNIGEEKEKGNQLTQATWPLLEKANINFIGNVESKEILSGDVDVVVCDGFVGNLVLKFAESIGLRVIDFFKAEIKKSPFTKLGALLLIPALTSLRKMVDYDESGGAPLLGLEGICIKAHGRAKASAIKNAIRVAKTAVKEDIVACIRKIDEK